HHHVGLTRRRSHDGSHPVDVHPARGRGHELDAATAGGHGKYPERVGRPPGEDLVQHRGRHRQSRHAEQRPVEAVLEPRPADPRPLAPSPRPPPTPPFRTAEAPRSMRTATKAPTATSPAAPTSLTMVLQGRISAASMSKRTKNSATT